MIQYKVKVLLDNTLALAYNILLIIKVKANKFTNNILPITRKYTEDIKLDAYLIGEFDTFYEVIEGVFTLKDGNKKLKVKTKYGRKL